jgi:exonuclease SbcC
MIPKYLSLKNFLSYREAFLDFTGLHTACICGPNGAGKTSLLEAIAWSIWGSSRATTEEDIIHVGEKEARVDFTFSFHGNTYRVIRSRRRGQSPALEFQVASGEGFITLTEKGVRATQQKILEHVKLDYDTFVNSAYLRQGRADEFMLKRATERKEILANLLKLEQYDLLAERAKERSREFKAKMELLEQNLESVKGQLERREAIATQQTDLQTALAQLQQQQDTDRERLQHLLTQQHHRQTWEKLLQGQQQQRGNLAGECRRLERELATARQQQNELAALLEQEAEISAGYTNFYNLQAAEETLSAKFERYQTALNRRQQLQEQQRRQLYRLERQLQQFQGRLDSLQQQEKENLDILAKRDKVEAGLVQLEAARNRLSELDRLHLEVTPLLQQRQQLQLNLERADARLNARLNELNASVRQLRHTQQQQQPKLTGELRQVIERIAELDNRKVYQNRVREKGQERHRFIEHLASNQREYDAKLKELDQKLHLLNQGIEGQTQEYPPCPLCDRPLDEHHWHLVVDKHQNQQKELRDLLWVVREQLTISEREIEVLRTEYREIQKEVANYDELRERRGRLQAQLDAIDKDEERVRELIVEAEEIERSLHTGDYAADLYVEINNLDRQLQALNYDEQDRALARNEEKRWRWAEIKQGEIKSAENRLAKINIQRPELEREIAVLEQQLEDEKTSSEIQQQIRAVENNLAEINYNIDEHNNVRSELRKSQFWLTRNEKLQQAKQQFPQVREKIETLETSLERMGRDLGENDAQIATLEKQLEKQLAESPDASGEIKILEEKIQQRRRELDDRLGSLGRLQQQLQQLDNLAKQSQQQQEELKTARRQYRVYQELSTAFGKKGIQALTIENLLPQLEAETNNILARLSANQLHVQFVTHKPTKKSKSSKKKTVKTIETLDILIADARGTRPYETYSGGEGFRINFSIRLALAKLLAQRAGTALQMLIIDEGFGTQDAEGCERLIAAINAIASDFSCILTVTHMPHLREAFQARIEVSKTPGGSQLNLLM